MAALLGLGMLAFFCSGRKPAPPPEGHPISRARQIGRRFRDWFRDPAAVAGSGFQGLHESARLWAGDPALSCSGLQKLGEGRWAGRDGRCPPLRGSLGPSSLSEKIATISKFGRLRRRNRLLERFVGGSGTLAAARSASRALLLCGILAIRRGPAAICSYGAAGQWEAIGSTTLR